MKFIHSTMLSVVGIAAILTCYQCTPTPLEQKIATAAIDLINCIDRNLGETPAQIAMTCGVAETPDLINLLSERKQVAAMHLSTSDAGPGK